MKQPHPNNKSQKYPSHPIEQQIPGKKETPHAPGAGSDKQHPDTPPPKDF